MLNAYFVFEDENEMDEEDYFEGEDFEGYAGNMPCDTYGMCGGTSCPISGNVTEIRSCGFGFGKVFPKLLGDFSYVFRTKKILNFSKK